MLPRQAKCEHGVLRRGRERSGDATRWLPSGGPASLKKPEMARTLSPRPGLRPDFSPEGPVWSPRAVGQYTVAVSHSVSGPGKYDRVPPLCRAQQGSMCAPWARPLPFLPAPPSRQESPRMRADTGSPAWSPPAVTFTQGAATLSTTRPPPRPPLSPAGLPPGEGLAAFVTYRFGI